MLNKTENLEAIRYPEYDRTFWNIVRGKAVTKPLEGGIAVNASHILPSSALNKFESELKKRSKFRNLARVHTLLNTLDYAYVYDSEDPIAFLATGESLPIEDIKDNFTKKTIQGRKIASISRFPETFANDCGFDIEDYLVKHLARRFAKTEDKAFLLGNGTSEPVGLLHDTEGAELGVTAQSESAITYDEVLSLYFSLDSDYRDNAVWIMTDETALALRKLKDEDGNYLWNSQSNTIMGKQVICCNYMPSMASGKKCILFGDLSYYWIMDKSPVSLIVLKELYAENGMTGILSFKFLDAKLMRTEAVKVLQMAEEEE